MYINDSVKSLLDSMVPPSEILITLQNGVKVPAALKRKSGSMDSRVHIQRLDKDYGSLTAIVGAMQRYPAHYDAHILFLNSNCTYPPHLINEYNLSIAELEKGLKQKLPDSNGSIYGLAGVVMAPDKNRNLDLEFDDLIGKSNSSFETRNLIGYVRENATVDYLESMGSVLIHRSKLKDDFLVYLSKVIEPTTEGSLSMDVVLSNYFAKHSVLRTQVCNLAINRFMLLRAGYLKNHKEHDEQNKRTLYERTVKHLRSKGCFYTYA
jgi:hypothetical protein